MRTTTRTTTLPHRLIVSATATFDRTLTALAVGHARGMIRRSWSLSLTHAERMDKLRAIDAVYNRPEYFTDPDTFFVPHASVTVTRTPVRKFRGGMVTDLTWPSRAVPLDPDVAERYLRASANHTAAARVFAHGDRTRPTLVLVHGYLGGSWRFEELVWPLRKLFRAGYDLVLPALPFHGVRADTSRKGAVPIFPASDPRITVEGVRQSVIDVRDLVKQLRDGGAPTIAVLGMSLGGYVTALLATLERAIDFAVPLIPLASFADFGRDLGRINGTAREQIEQHAMLAHAQRVVSPFARPSVLAPGRVLIVAGEGDRITPMAHAEQLAAHFDAPIERFTGGHLLQVGMGSAFDRVIARLKRAGIG